MTKPTTIMHPSLPKSYKGIYPFKIATTSFIYPDSYVQNVKMLAPYMDEIELLFFESSHHSLPSNNDIKKLFSLSKEYDLSFNIHLPLDISLSARDISIRHFAIETIKQIIDLTSPLSPSTFTLHLGYDKTDMEAETVKNWQNRTYNCMNQLISSGINGKKISIETLDYPLEWIEHILMDFNLSVCLDLGHLILYGFDINDVFERYKNKTSIIHLHGADEHRDHEALDRLSESNLKTILEMLKQFKGIVSIEVFSYKHLKTSLEYFENVWKNDEL